MLSVAFYMYSIDECPMYVPSTVQSIRRMPKKCETQPYCRGVHKSVQKNGNTHTNMIKI